MAEIYLRELRKEMGISLKQLEKITKIGKTTLSNMERGRTSPTIRQLDKICKGLKVTYKDIFFSEYNK